MVGTGRMICPRCGAEMNHHSDKLIYQSGDSGRMDPTLGGTVEEFHSCPNCGASASRAAD
jgi:ribosomal protein S27AE